MSSSADRRSGPRAPFHGEAVVEAGGRHFTCRAHNLSPTGMLLFPPVQARPGLKLHVRFTFPVMDEWLEADATLVREAMVHGHYAWGVRFEAMPPYVATLIRTYVRRTLRGEALRDEDTGSQPIYDVSIEELARHGAARKTPPTGPQLVDARRAPTGPQLRAEEVEPPREPQPLRVDDTNPFSDLPIASSGSARDVVETHMAVMEARVAAEEEDSKDLWDDEERGDLRRLYEDAIEEMAEQDDRSGGKKGWFS